MCTNKPGGFECYCPPGYGGDPYDGLCAPAQKQCSKDRECPGNEKCVEPGECMCLPPFFSDVLDGNKCKSPCERFACGFNAKCVLSDPPKCICEKGYKFNQQQQSCVDVDECVSSPCAYAALCINENGKYSCICPKGMVGNPYKSGCILDQKTSKSECQHNSDCGDKLACAEGVCVNPCSLISCESNTRCEIDHHAAWCRCIPGYVEDLSGGCISPCRNVICANGAQCVITTSGPTCKCAEGLFGNPFPGGKCTPDLCSNVNLCSDTQSCVNGRCKETCESITCGIGAHCDEETRKCTCDYSFIGRPELICMPPISPPICDPKCGLNAHCEYGIPNHCICNSNTNGNPYEKCVTDELKSCKSTQCGISAKCKETFSSVECECPLGYTGNPYVECKDVDECNGDVCGESAVCINTPGSYDCRCKEGYAGNPFVICGKVQGGICQDHNNCHCNSNILCPNGFSCEEGRCKNLCEKIKCGPKSGCDSGHCICPPGYKGNPNDLRSGCQLKGQCDSDNECRDSEICFQLGKGLRKCVDSCTKLQCGPNALCIGEKHKSYCICAPSYVGNPYDSTIGCQAEVRTNNKECTDDEDCVDGRICTVDEIGVHRCLDPCKTLVCGLHETCQVDRNHYATCACKRDFLRNPITSLCERPTVPDCKSDKDCQQNSICHPDPLGILKCTPICSQYTCALNSVCVAVNHKGSCECFPGFTGNPSNRTGCHPININQCSSDVQCSEQETCMKNSKGILTCKSACDSVNCGPNAVCVVNNHVPQCHCPPGSFIGDPNDPIKGCLSVPCVYNLDCPSHQLCNRLTHTCFDVCETEEEPCGANAVCIAENHKAVCQCPPGFRPNPIAEVECSPIYVCNPNPCHTTAICEASSTSFTCKCPLKQIGDPFKTGCKPEGECPNGDSDCPIESICHGNKCMNPCTQTVCGPNSVCNVVNRKPTCTCPAKFISAVNIARDGCLRILTVCVTDADCGGDICVNGQCGVVCRYDQDCSYGEKCQQNMCTVPCLDHNQCRSVEACIGGLCLLGCRHNKDCPSNQSCINNKCENPCLKENICGFNAICQCIGNSIVCKCSEGFAGNPTPQDGCVRISKPCKITKECPSAHMCIGNICSLPCINESACAIGERCSDNVCVKICHGDSNCLPGKVCRKGVCETGCTTDSDCKSSQICSRNKCICGPGFISSQSGCHDINECEENPCHHTAQCINVPGSYRCGCPSGTIGDPFVEPGCVKSNRCSHDSDCDVNLACKRSICIDPCADVTCGPNAICNTFNHKASCSCSHGFLGDPFDTHLGCFKVECQSNKECQVDKFCDVNSNKCLGELLR